LRMRSLSPSNCKYAVATRWPGETHSAPNQHHNLSAGESQILPAFTLLIRPVRRNRRGCILELIPASRQPVFSSHPPILHIRNIPGTLKVSHHPHHINSLQSTEHSSPSHRNILILRRSALLEQPRSQELRFASHIKNVFLHCGLHRHRGNHRQRRLHQHLVDSFQPSRLFHCCRVCLDPKHLRRRICMDSQQ